MKKDKGTTVVGYRNRNGQVVVRKTEKSGTDHNQYTYVLRCEKCGRKYGANGSDIWQRKCPSLKSECSSGGGNPGNAWK